MVLNNVIRRIHIKDMVYLSKSRSGSSEIFNQVCCLRFLANSAVVQSSDLVVITGLIFTVHNLLSSASSPPVPIAVGKTEK